VQVVAPKICPTSAAEVARGFQKAARLQLMLWF